MGACQPEGGSALVCIAPFGAMNSNIFALLDDDNDDDDSGAPPQKQAPKQAPAKEKKEEPKKAEQRKGKGGDDRRPRQNNNRRDNREESDKQPYDGSDKPDKPAEGERKGGKGRRREDGDTRKKGKGNRNREYDRQSGTGRGKGEEARGGRGKYNWGEKTEGGTEAAPEGETAEGEKPAPEVEPEVEEEDNTMTFEEYMKSKKASPIGPILEERKVSQDEAAAGKAYRRGDADGGKSDEYLGTGMIFSEYNGKTKAHEEKEAREGWVTADTVLQMKFVDPNAGAGKGDRDDRRGGKGKGSKSGKGSDRNSGGSKGGNNRAPRPAQQSGKALELDDANAFPSLA